MLSFPLSIVYTKIFPRMERKCSPFREAGSDRQCLHFRCLSSMRRFSHECTEDVLPFRQCLPFPSMRRFSNEWRLCFLSEVIVNACLFRLCEDFPINGCARQCLPFPPPSIVYEKISVCARQCKPFRPVRAFLVLNRLSFVLGPSMRTSRLSAGFPVEIVKANYFPSCSLAGVIVKVCLFALPSMRRVFQRVWAGGLSKRVGG